MARCRQGPRRPTGRRRRPEASAPSSARPRGVFSEMAPGNRALGDGGAGQVHGQASVRLEPLASERDNPADIVPLGTLSNSLTITTLLSVLGVCRDRFEAFGGFKVTSGAAGSG